MFVAEVDLEGIDDGGGCGHADGEVIDVCVELDGFDGLVIEWVGQEDMEDFVSLVVSPREKGMFEQEKGRELLKECLVELEVEDIFFGPEAKSELSCNGAIEILFGDGTEAHQDLQEVSSLSFTGTQSGLPIVTLDETIRDEELPKLKRVTHIKRHPYVRNKQTAQCCAVVWVPN